MLRLPDEVVITISSNKRPKVYGRGFKVRLPNSGDPVRNTELLFRKLARIQRRVRANSASPNRAPQAAQTGRHTRTSRARRSVARSGTRRGGSRGDPPGEPPGRRSGSDEAAAVAHQEVADAAVLVAPRRNRIYVPLFSVGKIETHESTTAGDNDDTEKRTNTTRTCSLTGCSYRDALRLSGSYALSLSASRALVCRRPRCT